MIEATRLAEPYATTTAGDALTLEVHAALVTGFSGEHSTRPIGAPSPGVPRRISVLRAKLGNFSRVVDDV